MVSFLVLLTQALVIVIVINLLTLEVVVVCVGAVEDFVLRNMVVINSGTALAC
jgi:hypothetical protein